MPSARLKRKKSGKGCSSTEECTEQDSKQIVNVDIQIGDTVRIKGTDYNRKDRKHYWRYSNCRIWRNENQDTPEPSGHATTPC